MDETPGSIILATLRSTCRTPSTELAALFELLARTAGDAGEAASVARRVGFRNRFQLHHALGRHDLPSLTALERGARLLAWAWHYDRSGAPLSRQAAQAGRDAKWCYREVRTIAGCPWTELRHLSLARIAALVRRWWRGAAQA